MRFSPSLESQECRAKCTKSCLAPYTNLLAGMEVVSLGEPTNSFGPNMWFVPYKIRFKDGGQKDFRLHVAQDPKTQRWFSKAGFRP